MGPPLTIRRTSSRNDTATTRQGQLKEGLVFEAGKHSFFRLADKDRAFRRAWQPAASPLVAISSYCSLRKDTAQLRSSYDQLRSSFSKRYGSEGRRHAVARGRPWSQSCPIGCCAIEMGNVP